MDKIVRHLNNLPRVLDDEGNPAKVPSKETIENAISFLRWIPTSYLKELVPAESITASPIGNIVIDWYKLKNFVSVEVSDDKIGFYAELPDGSSPSKSAASEILKDAVIDCLKLIY